MQHSETKTTDAPRKRIPFRLLGVHERTPEWDAWAKQENTAPDKKQDAS